MQHDPIPAGAPPVYAYMYAKAERFLKIGVEIYRRHDARGMPPADWDSDLLGRLSEGMRQITEGRGLTPETAFTDLGIDGFHALAATLHFKVEQQRLRVLPSTGFFLDEMILRHQAGGDTVSLFNKVRRPEVSL